MSFSFFLPWLLELMLMVGSSSKLLGEITQSDWEVSKNAS